MKGSPHWQTKKCFMPVFREVLTIAERWRLDYNELSRILGVSELELRIMKNGRAKLLNQDILVRMGHVIAIYKALHTIFPDATVADGWIRRPNSEKHFKCRPALELMCSENPEDLKFVRDYLMAEAAGN